MQRIYEHTRTLEDNIFLLQKRLSKLKLDGNLSFFSPLSDVGAHITISTTPEKEKGKKVYFKIDKIECKFFSFFNQFKNFHFCFFFIIHSYYFIFHLNLVKGQTEDRIGKFSKFNNKYYLDSWFVIIVKFDQEKSEYIPSTNYFPHISIGCHGFIEN